MDQPTFSLPPAHLTNLEDRFLWILRPTFFRHFAKWLFPCYYEALKQSSCCDMSVIILTLTKTILVLVFVWTVEISNQVSPHSLDTQDWRSQLVEAILTFMYSNLNIFSTLICMSNAEKVSFSVFIVHSLMLIVSKVSLINSTIAEFLLNECKFKVVMLLVVRSCSRSSSSIDKNLK